MPLLSLFVKKSKSPLKASSDVPSTVNVSLGDNEWVSVNNTTAVASQHPQRTQRQQQPSASSSGPVRHSNDDFIYDPPTRHSSLFPFQGDKPGVVFSSTQSLPGHSDPATRPIVSHKLSSPPPLLPAASKKSFFNWVSSKDRSHTTPSVKAASDSGDPSFNLKSFRHIRSESPSFNSSSSTTLLPRPLSPPTPMLVPVPTSTLPPPPVSFQVTSRKPRLPPMSSPLSDTLPASPTFSLQSSSSQTPQSRIVAGAFRQAARRSATSLTLGDPIVSPGTALEDTSSSPGIGTLSFESDINNAVSFLSSSPPKLSLSSFLNSSTTDVSNNSNSPSTPRPPRSHPPPNFSYQNQSFSSTSYTQLPHSSASISIPPPLSTVTLNSPLLTATSSSALMPRTTPARSTPSSSKPLPARTSKNNNIGGSSFDSSESEEESESASGDSDTGIPHVSRKRTVRPRNNTAGTTLGTSPTTVTASGRPRAATAAPAPSRLSVTVPVSNSKTDLPSLKLNAAENVNSWDRLSASVSTPVHSPASPHSSPTNGARPRASASVGALHPSAKEARASAMLVNSRISAGTDLSTPKPMNKPSAGSDTSESSESASDSEKSDDDDAPLSKLVPPKRPGTSMSSYSTNSNSSLRKPLVDLSSPSTFSGRPIGAPAPISREEEEMPRPRILVDAAGRSSPDMKNSNTSIKVAPPSRLQLLSQQQPGMRLSNAPLSSASSISSPSSSGASLSTSLKGVGGASSDSSVSPIDYHSKYHSFANGATNPTGDNSAITKPGAGNSPSKSSVAGSPTIILPSVLPPMRPFQRRESPATSSTGDSSSGKVPLTPKDGTDIRHNNRTSMALVPDKDRPRPTHGRKTSVTFEDEVPSLDKSVGNTYPKVKENDRNVEEAKRRERRRGEARAAIELGKVVNGPPPVDDEETGLDSSAQVTWPQLGMQMPMQVPMQVPMQMSMQPMFPMGGAHGGMGGMGMPTQFQMALPTSMPNNDPAFFAAHQQAMSIAKQAYQYAVAQQALSAANDEWERSSTMTGFMPVNGYMNMNMRGSMLFPPAPASMYAGNTGGGSLINGYGAGNWGETRSVYGHSFGPSTPMGMRLSTYSSTDLMALNPAMAGSASVVNSGGPAQGKLGQQQQRPGVRQRTRTAPSSSPTHGSAPPIPSPSKSAIRPRAPAPPSSFRGVHHH